jgi:predicted AAA+ superfamily ATPase
MAKIYRRKVFDDILPYLYEKEIIVINGARQVGKTYVLYYLRDHLLEKKEQVYYLDLEDSRLLKTLDAGIDSLARLLREEGFDPGRRVFVLIDEIQYLADPSNFLKLAHDHLADVKLVVSGSSSFDIKRKFKDSLTGRTVNFELFPLSFAEFLLFREISLPSGSAPTPKKLAELAELQREFVLFGAYPGIVLSAETEKREKRLQQVIDTYIRKDIREIGNIRDIDKFNLLLETLAAQSGKLLNVLELANTCRLAKQTVENYLFILENTYVLRRVKPFHGNIRSELFKTPKIFFYDSGLQQLLWLKKFPGAVMGSVFETAVFAELVKRYGKEAIHFWRTSDKQEIDFVVRKGDLVLPLEAKLNFNHFNPAAINHFLKQYGLHSYRLLGLEGASTNPQARCLWQEWD